MLAQRYRTLDGMRGIAALVVAVYHLQSRYHVSMLAGYLAVDLFFMMSGFVISASYGSRMGKDLDFFKFSSLRLIRLLPIYYIGFLLGLAKQVAGMVLGQPGLTSTGLGCDVLFGLAVLPTPCGDEFFPLNGPAWSLFFELLASAAFAIVLWRMKSTSLAVVAGVAGMALILIIGPPSFFNVGWAWSNAGGGVARTAFSFCVGILLQRAFRSEWRHESWWSLLPLAFAFLAMIKFDLPPALSRSVVEIVIVLFAFPIVLALGCLWDPPALLRRPFELLGDMSYPAYAIHWTIITVVLQVADRLHIGPDLAIGMFLLALVPSAFVAGMADRMIRRSLRRKPGPVTLVA